MGKDPPKDMRPSTTRRGTDLPSRPNFSPNVTSAIVAKKKNISSSPLSKMSTSTENNEICGSMDKEVTPATPELPEIPESSIITSNVESELEDNEYCDDNYDTSSEEEDAFHMAFMDPNFDKLDKLDSYKNSPLDDYFSVAKKVNAPAIDIKDEDYKLVVILKLLKNLRRLSSTGEIMSFL